MSTVCSAVLLSALSGLPSEWVAEYESGHAVASAEYSAARDAPVIGNGFVGWRVGPYIGPGPAEEVPNLGQQDPRIGGMYAAQVYNGYHNASTPSHRAHLPAPTNIWLSGEGLNFVASKLNLESGLYTNRSGIQTPSGCKATVDTSQLAHRRHMNLILLHINGTAQSGQCSFGFDPIGQLPHVVATDFTFRNYTMSQSGVSYSVFQGTTLLAETNTSGLSKVGIVCNEMESEFTFSPSKPLEVDYRCVVKTTAESGQGGMSEDQLVSAAVKQLVGFQNSTYVGLLEENLEEMRATAVLGGIEVTGNGTVARALNSSLYYLTSSVRGEPDAPFGLSGCGLQSDGYFGRIYWDTEYFQLPPLLLLNPKFATPIVKYRHRILPYAKKQAAWFGFEGSMFSWESSVTGAPCNSPGAAYFNIYEQHLNGDIAMGYQRYYRMTNDTEWLRTDGWDVSQNVCKFWSSRLTKHETSGNWTVLNVVPPDEHAGVRNSSVYTNVVAAMSLDWCIKISEILDLQVPDIWRVQAKSPHAPLAMLPNATGPVHPEYEGYNGGSVNQDDVGLLVYPLNWNLPRDVALRDLQYYMDRTPADGMFTGDSMYSIAEIQLQNYTLAETMWDAAFRHQVGGYNAWRERESGGAVNFLTGAGGFLMNMLYGWGGARVTDTDFSLNPKLPPGGVTEVHIRSMSYMGAVFSVRYDEKSTRITTDTSLPFVITDSSGAKHSTSPMVLPPGRISIVIRSL